MTSATNEQQITEKKSHAISALHQALALLQDDFSSEQTEHVLTALQEARNALIILEFLAQNPEEIEKTLMLNLYSGALNNIAFVYMNNGEINQ